MLTNVILVILLLAIAAGALIYLYRSKKSGAHCVGCPHSKNCGSNCSCGSPDSLNQKR